MIDYTRSIKALGCDMPFGISNDDMDKIVKAALVDRVDEAILRDVSYGSIMHLSSIEALRIMYILHKSDMIHVSRVNAVDWMLILINVAASAHIPNLVNSGFDYADMAARMKTIYCELESPPNTPVTSDTIENAKQYVAYSAEMRRRNNIKPTAEF